MAAYEELQQSVMNGQADKVKELVNALIAKGTNPAEIISQGLMGGMSVVGTRFKAGDMFIPEVLASAQAMSEGLEIVKPLITGEKLSTMNAGKVLMGTVQGDLHNIGKKIVSMVLESGGFTVVDIGVDITVDKFVAAVKQEQPDILGLSALLTTTIPRMKDVIDALTRNGLRDKVRVIIGGAPVTQSFAGSIGADAYAPDAITALDKARQLMGTMPS